MKFDAEIKLRAPTELKEELGRIAAKKHRRPAELIREHLWSLVDSEKPKLGEQQPQRVAEGGRQ